jgi:excinuclease ABC subunit C
MPSIQSLKNKIDSLPKSPGCYIYKDSAGTIIYIGKAKSLYHRVHQYFVEPERLEPKIAIMVPQIVDLDFVVTDSEMEAFLLETNLIKKYRPKYNQEKKDDKNYVWLMFETNLDFPKISIVREKKKKGVTYIGPYPSTLPLKRILRMLRKVYPYRTCNRVINQETVVNSVGTKTINIKSSDPKPCLFYYLHLCDAPCAGLVQKDAYRRNISNVKRFFNNEKQVLSSELQTEMQQQAKNHNFERAAILRDKVADLNYISQRIHIDTGTDEYSFEHEKKERTKQAVAELVKLLDTYSFEIKPGFKMECYDISNISGTNAVSAMVVFVDGKPAKNLYRKFKIRTKSSPDDFEMLREVFRRRFSEKELTGKDESFSKLPELIVVDGGKGQLSATYTILRELNINVPIIGLAKKREEIFMPHEEEGELQFSKRTLRNGSESKFLIQRLRDEAHRFGIRFHRSLRSKSQVHSQLDDIPGVGEIVKLKLLKAFGSVEGIKKATDHQISEVIKNKTTVGNLRKLL